MRVLWVLEELRISYETIKVDPLEPNPAIKSPHPRGKVPYQIDGNNHLLMRH
ncbi:glutathione S-transferase N-terminal domain-containing protein [Citrobacter freundii]|uniref:glutathione S-transferase N-terminal domain-containing protein n=1 Tax=Citrobacter sp. Cm046 TaxID=2985118 RepID=UPI0024DED605|nr:glutathione S-transferase N-terminal domain-containing protein [Citrobacter sp. Cm046]MDK2358381.1 glutathione S-transferase N-terminal domain-containing protein [Citrobacter freundii]MDM2928377.1 glutathione S-transferase N-terminal domain-containing protein [Citrobacter sp. Cm046]